MKNTITLLLFFSLFCFVGCSPSTLVTTTTERLDNMDIMGRYVLNNLVRMEVSPLSKNQVSIKVSSSNGCNFLGIGNLLNNTVTILGVHFSFSKRVSKVTGNGLGKCGGEYVKTTFVQG